MQGEGRNSTRKVADEILRFGPAIRQGRRQFGNPDNGLT